MGEDGRAYLFLTGADMDPSAVLKRYPGARFVARGRFEAHAGDFATRFGETVASAGVADAWGIVVEVPAEAVPTGDLKRRTVTTDDGRTIEALQIGHRLADGLSHLVLAAARYWELPPGYVGRLKMAVHELGKAEDED